MSRRVRRRGPRGVSLGTCRFTTGSSGCTGPATPQLVGVALEDDVAVAQHDELGFVDLPVVGADGARMSPVLAHGRVRRDVERVAQLVRDDDGADAFEVAQLDDLGVDGHRGDRVEPGRRLVVEQDLAAWPSSRARSRRAAADRPTAPRASCRCARPARRSPAPPRPGGPRPRAACRSPRTACSRRSRARSASRTARLPGTPCRDRPAPASSRLRSARRRARRSPR